MEGTRSRSSGRAGAATSRDIEAELVSVAWVRIQETVRLRPSSHASLDPDEVALMLTTVPGTLMRATRASRDDGRRPSRRATSTTSMAGPPTGSST